MADQKPKAKQHAEAPGSSTVLAFEGTELSKNLWETGVYLGADGYVYYIYAEEKRGQIKKTILGKRTVGEYLRWVDELFLPGNIPSESNAVHFRAARKLRELI